MVTLRRLAELAARNRALKRRLPSPFNASILVSPDSQLKYVRPGTCGFDPMLLEVAANQITPGMTVWDVGANVGVFSVAAAALGGSVIAFEPDSWLAALLERTRALPENRKLDLKVVTAAISDKNGVAEFIIAERGRASNALAAAGGRTQMGGARATCLVPTLTLDCVGEVLPWPEFIKIDVEGAELLVLEGASKLLRQRPRLLIEVGEDESRRATDVLRGLGYSLFDASKQGQREQIVTCVENTLALPA